MEIQDGTQITLIIEDRASFSILRLIVRSIIIQGKKLRKRSAEMKEINEKTNAFDLYNI